MTDPDAGDKQTFQVSDSRFEVVGGQLKLKDGDRSTTRPSRPSTSQVTATDRAATRSSRPSPSASATSTRRRPASRSTARGGRECGRRGDRHADRRSIRTPADSQSFVVADGASRWSMASCKLKDGVSARLRGRADGQCRRDRDRRRRQQDRADLHHQVGDVNEAPTARRRARAGGRERSGAVIGTLLGDRPGCRRQPQLLGLGQPLRGGRRPAEAQERRVARLRGRAVGQRHGDRHRQRRPADSQTFTISVSDVNEAPTARLDRRPGHRERGGRGDRHALGRRPGCRRRAELHGVGQPLRGGQRPAQAEERRVARLRGRAASVNVTVTATDAGGHQIQQTFTVNVTQRQRGADGHGPDRQQGRENAAGAVIGTLWSPTRMPATSRASRCPTAGSRW